MALLELLVRWRRDLPAGPRLLAATVDHGLRADAADEAAMVKARAKQLGVSHRTLRWTGAKPATGLQEAARTARYRLLAQAARRAGAGVVLTAHTLDDQAETVLLRLARGSGLAGLRAMARETAIAPDVRLVRPLLEIPKVRLVATLAQAGVGFATDPSNADGRFTRARWRGAMPALAAEGLDARRLALFAARVRRADAALEAAVDAAAADLSRAGEGAAYDAAGYFALPPEIALRLLGRAVVAHATEGAVELGKLEALADWLSGMRRVAAGTRRARRTLAGAMVTLQEGLVSVSRAPARGAAKGVGAAALPQD